MISRSRVYRLLTIVTLIASDWCASAAVSDDNAGLRRALTHYFAAVLSASGDEAIARDEILNELADLSLRSPPDTDPVQGVVRTSVDQATTLVGPLNSSQHRRIIELVENLATYVNSRECIHRWDERWWKHRERRHWRFTQRRLLLACVPLAAVPVGMSYEAPLPTLVAISLATGTILSSLHAEVRVDVGELDRRETRDAIGAGLRECARVLGESFSEDATVISHRMDTEPRSPGGHVQ